MIGTQEFLGNPLDAFPLGRNLDQPANTTVERRREVYQSLPAHGEHLRLQPGTGGIAGLYPWQQRSSHSHDIARELPLYRCTCRVSRRCEITYP